MTKKRPTSITIISWYFIIAYALALTSIPIALLMPVARESLEATGTPLGLSLGFTFFTCMIMIFSGVLILKVQKSGKYIALAYMPLSMILGSVMNGLQASMITGIIIYAVVFYFLIRMDAKLYFDHEWTAPDAITPEIKEPVGGAVASDLLVYERVVEGETRSRIVTVDLNDDPSKGPSMGRKIAGTAFFFIGDGILITTITMILPIMVKLPERMGLMIGAVMSGIMLVITGILILIGFLFWGFRNWRALVTIGTLITGAWTALGALGMISIQFSPQYDQIQELNQNQNFDFMTLGIYMMIAGLANMAIAACLSSKFKIFLKKNRIERN
jgi:hypothetical protein